MTPRSHRVAGRSRSRGTPAAADPRLTPVTPQTSHPARPSRLLPGEKTVLKVTGGLLAVGAFFYAGYLVGGTQSNGEASVSDRCTSIKAEARKHIEKGDRLLTIDDGQLKASAEFRTGAHLMINNTDCYTPGEIASAQTLLDTVNKAP
ncbi:hypothetical protein Sme01_02660 [Sphaerisporangium melleum]|uniref:Uncharacterized protein n=1 Tax=Sphaerisporangium melleum TaxID=321316 RepID=A0A917QNF3_9ACTN|nr:hypothetical protein GCM10007964_00200 [Sphaerisporangium melleum]GII67790.1 hypothetical protein Sme01_02660 [Sphaerisporangium melleum]